MAGRPKKKPEYNPELQFNNFLQELRDVYEEADSLRSLADELNISLLMHDRKNMMKDMRNGSLMTCRLFLKSGNYRCQQIKRSSFQY